MVVCDNSALSALAEIDLLFVLPELFRQITITQAVFNEGLHPGAPKALRGLLDAPPAWLEVHADPDRILKETRSIGLGEATSITLCNEGPNQTLLIIDEKKGRGIATQLGIQITGVLAIIGKAAARNLLDFDEAIQHLLGTGFYVSPRIIDAVKRSSFK